MKHILFVDDEEVYSREYRRELIQHGFRVTYESTPKGAVNRIMSGEKFDLLLTDLMMFPRGIYSNEEAGDGMFTGALIAMDFHKASNDTPIIIFTATHSSEVINEIRNMLGHIPKVLVLQKKSLNPRGLSEAIENLFSNRPRLNEVMRLFMHSIIMQPNAFGIGVDLKKLVRVFHRR